MKNTKKSLLMSAISLLLCISMLISSTFAWFTDSVTSAGNKIQSGTLKVDLELLDEETSEWNSLKENRAPIFNYDKWEPGYVDTKVLKVENEGSLALKWVAQFCSEQQLSILADVIDVYVCASESEIGYPEDRNLDGYTCVGNLTTFINSIEKTTRGTLEAGEVAYLGIALKMREEAGNEYQNLSLGGAFDIRIYATQYTSESDSFNNQYDKNATFEDLANTSIMATATKTLAAGVNALDFDLSYNGLKIAKVIVPASAIANTAEPVTVTFDGINPSQAAIVDDNTKAYSYDIKVTNLKDNLSGDQLITVVVTAPNALAAMKAYHNGTLIQDAVYDEVEGTITFKTANFSPYDFTYQEKQVATLEELRAAVKESNVEIKLTEDLDINLEVGSPDRSDDHKAKSTDGKTMWYNAVNIVGENVAIDLNGHKITVKCSDAHDGNQDVGALFFVDKDGSLNIIDRKGGGFIKMESSIYMVWAPFNTPSYMDIYGGAFIADGYAGDPIGTPIDKDGNHDFANGSMKNENSNRALVYAGTGGNMNIYGGYFLYNNTPNDIKNRNNGAFNCTNGYEGDRPFITIHDGVMLIDKAYRQDPTNTSVFQNILKENPNAKPTDPGILDNSSIKLEESCELAENKLLVPITIDGKEYSTWYKVISGITSITAKANKSVYDIGHKFTTEDFIVYAVGEGASGNITNFTIATVDTSTAGEKAVEITYTNAAGVKSTATCIVKIVNLTKLEIDYTAQNKYYDTWTEDYHRMWWFGAGNVDVSGWLAYPELGYAGEESQLTMTGGNGEKISGFEKDWHLIQNSHADYQNSGVTHSNDFKSNNNWYGLTIDNALPYTTLGINCVVGYDAPVLGFGYYINGEVSTLMYNAPAIYHEGDGTYGYYPAHALTQFTCYDFEPGKSYTVTWVVVFEDGIQKLTDWTVNMKAASANDKVFVDTEKPNANVIIMAGQSNMFGPAPLTNEIISKYANVDFSNVHIKYSNINFNVNPDGSVANTLSTVFSNSDFETYKVGMGAQGNSYFGPELALAYYLATTEGLKDQQWYLVKYAPAGTALNGQWTNTCTLDGKRTKLTDSMLDYVQTALDSLTNKGFDVQVQAFMWMQGESDAANSNNANRYADAEENLVKQVREKFAAYTTRPVGSVIGSGMTFINAGIADNYTGKNDAQGGPNDWIYSSTVNDAKISNSQFLCSAPGITEYEATDGGALGTGPLAGNVFNQPTISNPNSSGAIINSIYIDTHHLLSKYAAHQQGLEDYINDSDDKDKAHYCADSMYKLGEFFGSCFHFMKNQYK